MMNFTVRYYHDYASTNKHPPKWATRNVMEVRSSYADGRYQLVVSTDDITDHHRLVGWLSRRYDCTYQPVVEQGSA